MDQRSRPQPAVPPLAAYTGYLLRRAYARSRRVAAAAIPPPHTVGDVDVLRILAAQGALSQQDLGRRAGINRSLIGKLVTGLETRGLVTRARNPSDRRATAIELTRSGRTAVGKLTIAVAQGEAGFLDVLSPPERDRLDTLLREVVRQWAPDAADDGPHTTGGLLEQAHFRLRSAAAQALSPLGLHPRHFGVLAALVAEQPCSQRHLALYLGISAPVVLEMLDALAATGLLRRVRSTVDRRLNDVTLTPAGRECAAAAAAAAARIQAQVAEHLGAGPDSELRHLLTKLLTGGLPDGGLPDGGLPEGGLLEGGLLEGGRLEGRRLDSTLPDPRLDC